MWNVFHYFNDWILRFLHSIMSIVGESIYKSLDTTHQRPWVFLLETPTQTLFRRTICPIALEEHNIPSGGGIGHRLTGKVRVFLTKGRGESSFLFKSFEKICKWDLICWILALLPRPHSDTSVDSSPHRSRKTSQRSRAGTMDNHVTHPLTSYPEYTSPVSPPEIERTLPQASSSILTEQTRHQPHLHHNDSRLSHSSGKRSRAGTTDSRLSKDPVDPESRYVNPRGDNTRVDILRTEHDTPEQYTYRTRSSVEDEIPPRGPYDVPVESLESSPRVLDSKKTGHRRPGHQRTSMSSVDSRVSTPLFHPGARPKDTRRGRDKTRPPTAETERGFDSGFFGSEESRGSRLTHSPEVRHSTAHDQNKLRHPSLREQTLSESEQERFNLPSTQTPVRSASKSRDQRRRRPYLKSLSESDEERGLETSPSKTSLRSSTNQRERRGHRHTPTFPATRSDSERIRRPDESLRRPSSSPNLFDEPDLRRSTRTLRPDSLRKSATEVDRSTRIGKKMTLWLPLLNNVRCDWFVRVSDLGVSYSVRL